MSFSSGFTQPNPGFENMFSGAGSQSNAMNASPQFQYQPAQSYPQGNSFQQSMALPVGTPDSPQVTLQKGLAANIPPYLVAKLESNIAHEGDPRGSLTRGWGANSPRKGHERHDLAAQCGSAAFLRPEDEGYPVVAYDRGGSKQSCAISESGVNAAISRSAQYHQTDIEEKARALRKAKFGY